MHDVTITHPLLRTMPIDVIGKVRRFEKMNLAREQVPIETRHLIHAGIGARSITIPAGIVLTGVLIKIPTILIISGDTLVYMGEDDVRHLVGYHVIPAEAGRKQVFLTNGQTELTMLFCTDADSVVEMENQFTDEPDLLFSRRGHNVVNITGVKS